MRKPIVAGVIAAAAFGIAQSAGAGDQARDYVVLYEQGASAAQARAAVEDAGGRVVSENPAIGLATVRSTEADFAREAAGASRRSSAPRRTGRSGRRREQRRAARRSTSRIPRSTRAAGARAKLPQAAPRPSRSPARSGTCG